MWWTTIHKQHNTICGGHHYTYNTTQYVVDLTIRKQTTQHNMWWTSQTTQHNMWWTSLYINKQHNTICGGHHYT